MVKRLEHIHCLQMELVFALTTKGPCCAGYFSRVGGGLWGRTKSDTPSGKVVLKGHVGLRGRDFCLRGQPPQFADEVMPHSCSHMPSFNIDSTLKALFMKP